MSFWRDDFTKEEITLVLDKLKAMRTVTEDRKVTFTGAGDFDAWLAFLVSATGFEARTDSLRTSIIRRALFSPDLPENFTEKDFKAITYQSLDWHQNKNISVYRVAFPIWNKPRFLTGTRKVDDVTLNFSPSPRTSMFSKIAQERNAQRSDHTFREFFTIERVRDLKECSLCIATVTANNPRDANERASEAIYEILGLLNLAADAGKHWRVSFSPKGKLPVSDVLIGPQTTVHLKGGKLALNGYWHENWNGGPGDPITSEKKGQAWEKRFKQLSEGLSRSLWSDWCKSACRRYFKAFSNPNLDESFLDGWRLFENIAGPRSEKAESKIIRASNIFQENVEYRIVGKHLKLRRDLISHGHAIKTDDQETLSFQMLQFVHPFLERFILNAFSFSAPAEFWEFLDLPASKAMREIEHKALKRRVMLLEKAAQFRGENG